MTISRRMGGEGYVEFMEQEYIQGFGKKLEENLSLGRLERRFEHIK